MKSVLYVGATLMIGASIYGFVDYKKTSHSKEFTEMYESTEPRKAVVTEPSPVIEEKAAIKPVDKKISAKKAQVKEEPVITKSKIEVTAAEKLASEPVVVKDTKLKENNTGEKYKKAKKRKLNTKLFSRAPLREEIEITDLPVPVKTDAKKAAVKEQ